MKRVNDKSDETTRYVDLAAENSLEKYVSWLPEKRIVDYGQNYETVASFG